MGQPEDGTKSRQWFEDAAGSGDLVGAFNFGICLAEGVGIERDDRRAAMWLRRAAEGIVNAQYWYGRMLLEGRGLEPDFEEGRAWITRAADAGMVDAEVTLAEMLVNGRAGTTKDHARAMKLFEHAAQQGHAGAMFALGAMHGGGHDVPTDTSVALRWFAKAAERNHPYAQLMLGRYLASGTAGNQDIEAARVWLLKAQAAGIAEAANDLAALPPGTPAPTLRTATR
jgi:TPR repeat protein